MCVEVAREPLKQRGRPSWGCRRRLLVDSPSSLLQQNFEDNCFIIWASILKLFHLCCDLMFVSKWYNWIIGLHFQPFQSIITFFTLLITLFGHSVSPLFLLYSPLSRSDLVNPVQQLLQLFSFNHQWPSYIQIDCRCSWYDIVWLLISDKLESPLLETNMRTELGSRHTFGYPGYRDEPPDLWFSGTLLPDHTFSYL